MENINSFVVSLSFMPVKIVTLLQLFLFEVSLGLFVMAALTFTRRRQAPQSGLLVLAMCAEAFYCFGYAQEMAQTTLAGAIFWLRVEYIGIPWIPALWVLIGRRHFGLRGRAVLLSIIPVIVAIAEWTNSMHGLYDRSMMLVPRGPFWVVEVHRGPIAWLNLAFLYGSLVYGMVLCLSRIRASSGLVRLQSIFFASSCVPPLIGYLIYFLGWSQWGLDLAPLTLCLTVALVYVAVFRLEWFHLIPTVRSLVFKSIRDSVLAIDLRHRLVDFNPPACALFPWLSESCLSQELSSVFPERSGFLEAFSTSASVQELRDEVGIAAAEIGEQGIRVTLSVGLTVYMPDDPADPRELLQQADQALYSAKSDGRNRVGVWRGLSARANTGR